VVSTKIGYFREWMPGRAVKVRRCPAAVTGTKPALCHWGFLVLGRRRE